MVDWKLSNINIRVFDERGLDTQKVPNAFIRFTGFFFTLGLRFSLVFSLLQINLDLYLVLSFLCFAMCLLQQVYIIL